MTKQEYLSAIRGKIRKMPADDINKFMDYYSEMIDDRMEDGLSEEDAVADMDAPDDVVDQILADMPLTKLVNRERAGHCHGGCHFGTSPVLLCDRTLDGSCRYRRAAGSYSIFCYTECSGCPFHAWSCICRNRTCDPVHRSRKACYDRHFQAVQGIRQWN